MRPPAGQVGALRRVGSPVSPRPARPDEDNRPRGWFIGECGHAVPVQANGRVYACECETASSRRRRTEADLGAAIDTSGRPDYLAQLCTAIEELARSRYLLGEVIELADDVPGLTDAELRDRLVALADRARNGSSGSTDPRPAAG